MAMMRTTTPGSLTGSLSASGTMSANITVGTVNMAAADMTNYYDKEEVDGLLEGKADLEHSHDEYVTEDELAAKLGEKANKEHTHEEYAVKKTIEYKDTTPEQLEISEDTSVIRMNIQQDTTIVLPTNLEFSDAHEITLFLNIAEEAVVSFDNVALWQNEPVLEVGTVCELIFTWSGSQWLGGCIVYGTQL